MPSMPTGRLAAVLAAAALVLGPGTSASAADRTFAPALGTLPAADTLDEWEALSYRLTLAETVNAGIVAGATTALTFAFLDRGLPTDSQGWLAVPIAASFGLGSVAVGIARGVNLARYRRERAAALASGHPLDPRDLAAVRRWQARENRAVAAGMLVHAGVSAALLAALNLSRADEVAGEDFVRGLRFTLAVSLSVDAAAGLTLNAVGQRELYWLSREGR